jgi:hypothetical protein
VTLPVAYPEPGGAAQQWYPRHPLVPAAREQASEPPVPAADVSGSEQAIAIAAGRVESVNRASVSGAVPMSPATSSATASHPARRT